MKQIFVLLFLFLPVVASATPVIETYTAQNSAGVAVDSLGLTKPSGVQAGDLLIIIVGNDESGSVDCWETTIDTEAGWTQFFEEGSSTSDCYISGYWKEATGTDASSVYAIQNYGAPDEQFGWMIRISGANTASPIDVVGSFSMGSGTSDDAPEVTTTEDDCLAFYVAAIDGGDAVAFSASGTGWSETDEEYSGTGSADACGSFGTKTQASAGLTGDATISWTPSDGYVTVQFAIAPGEAPAATYTPVIMIHGED